MTFKEYKEEAWRCRSSRERGRHVAIRAANALINCAELGDFYEKKTKQLEAENRALRERVQWLEGQNADLCNQLRRAMSHDNNSLSAFLNDAIECASHRP